MMLNYLYNDVFPGSVHGGIDKSVLVWEHDNYTIGTALDTNVTIPLSADIRQKGHVLQGWLTTSLLDDKSWTIDNHCKFSSGNQYMHHLDIKQDLLDKCASWLKRVELFRKRRTVVITMPLTSNLNYVQNVPKLLLEGNLLSEGDRGTTIIDASAQPAAAAAAAIPHFKYAKKPLKIRISDFDSVVLTSNRLEYLYDFSLPIHRMSGTATTATRGKVMDDQFYEPSVRVDDSSLITRYYAPISQNISSPHPTITLSIVPTGNVKLGSKLLLLAVMQYIEEYGIFGRTELDELKIMLSDEMLYRLLLSNVLGWVHLSLQYAAFKNDYQFFVVCSNVSTIICCFTPV